MKRKNLSLQNSNTYDYLRQTSFKIGPQLKRARPPDIGRRIKKLIHYDCKQAEDLNDDVPDEEEVYVKENLLKKNKEEDEEDADDELEMVNVNVSVLVSEDEDNCNVSEEPGDDVKTINEDKLMSHRIEGRSVIQEENEEDIDLNDYKKPQINIFNININHQKSNVFSDKKLFKTQRKSNELMVRDIKSLHLITKKALLNLTNKAHDTIENKGKNGLHNFKSNSMNLYVSDQSDYPVGFNNMNRNKIPFVNSSRIVKSKEKEKENNVINIINFNNNYKVGAIVLTNSNKSDKNQWRSPLDSSTLNQIFKTSTPKYNKNFIFNKQFSLQSVTNSNEKEIKESEYIRLSERKGKEKKNDIKKIIQVCKENKTKNSAKKFVKFK